MVDHKEPYVLLLIQSPGHRRLFGTQQMVDKYKMNAKWINSQSSIVKLSKLHQIPQPIEFGLNPGLADSSLCSLLLWDQPPDDNFVRDQDSKVQLKLLLLLEGMEEVDYYRFILLIVKEKCGTIKLLLDNMKHIDLLNIYKYDTLCRLS